jgi:hypothetical protein
MVNLQQKTTIKQPDYEGWVMVFIATFKNISVITWGSVLLVEETGIKPSTCRKSLTNFIT